MVALIIKDKTTIEQKDQHGKLALDLAVMYNNNGSHDSIIQLLKTAGVEDKAANHAVDDRGKPQPLCNLPERTLSTFPQFAHRESTELYVQELGVVFLGFPKSSGISCAEAEIDHWRGFVARLWQAQL